LVSTPEVWAKRWHSIMNPERKDKKRVLYEYKCPFCGYVNTRTGPRGRIVCSRCGMAFTP